MISREVDMAWYWFGSSSLSHHELRRAGTNITLVCFFAFLRWSYQHSVQLIMLDYGSLRVTSPVNFWLLFYFHVVLVVLNFFFLNFYFLCMLLSKCRSEQWYIDEKPVSYLSTIRVIKMVFLGHLLWLE